MTKTSLRQLQNVRWGVEKRKRWKKNIKLHTFLLTVFHMCSFLVLMPSVTVDNINSHEKKNLEIRSRVVIYFAILLSRPC